MANTKSLYSAPRDEPGFLDFLMHQFMQLRSPVSRIIAAQLAATLIVSVVAVLAGWQAAYSAMLGGLSVVVPGAVVAGIYERSAGRLMRPVIQGELWKFALSIICFTGVFTLVRPLNAGFYFGMFVMAQAMFAVIPLIDASRLRSPPKH